MIGHLLTDLPQAHSKAGLGSERAPGGCDVNEMKVKTEHDAVSMGHMETLPLGMKHSRPRENISSRGAEHKRSAARGREASALTAVFVLAVVTEQQGSLVTSLSHLLHWSGGSPLKQNTPSAQRRCRHLGNFCLLMSKMSFRWRSLL